MNAKSASNRTRHSSLQRKSRGGTLLGMFLGLLLGLLCAFGVVWYLNKTPLPFLDKTPRPEKNEAKPAGDLPQQPGQPQQLPGKPGDKAIIGTNDKPRFEFYKILPGTQEATPGTATTDTRVTAVPPPEGQPAPVAELFYLQAGAFQKPADADNLKAKLALMGLEASVQEAASADKSAMYRVRVGPYAKPEEMNRARNQLAQNGIQASVVKIKEIAPSH
jgi:cell division protein FtsN